MIVVKHPASQIKYPIEFNYPIKKLISMITSITRNKLPTLLSDFINNKTKICLVFDKNTYQLFENAHSYQYKFVMPCGEKFKNTNTVNQLHRFLFSHQFKRNDCVISIGGGIVSDLTGYASSTYMRSMKWVTCPTTLLSMVDATLGGKTGVNNQFGKNLIGNFYHPKCIFLDISTLKTLPKDEFINGLAEMIKHGIIYDRSHYNEVLNNINTIINAAPATKSILYIQNSLQIKRKIVEKDPYEQNLRKILNFGHTIGHAIERQTNFRLSHGKCIMVGMLIESHIANNIKLLPNKAYQEIYSDLSKRFFLKKQSTLLDEVNSSAQIKASVLQKYLLLDKKNIDQNICFALPRTIGKAVIIEISYSKVKEILDNCPFIRRGKLNL